jgi:predicted ester cyclase
VTASTTDASAAALAVVLRLYAAYNAHDVDGVLECWRPGGVEHLPLVGDMTVPGELGQHLRGFYGAFPDALAEVHSVVVDPDGRVAAQVGLSGTFTGNRFDGLRSNGRRWTARMAEFFVTEDGLITRMDAYMDNMDLARQLDLLPPEGGPMESLLRRVFNLKVAARQLLRQRR